MSWSIKSRRGGCFPFAICSSSGLVRCPSCSVARTSMPRRHCKRGLCAALGVACCWYIGTISQRFGYDHHYVYDHGVSSIIILAVLCRLKVPRDRVPAMASLAPLSGIEQQYERPLSTHGTFWMKIDGWFNGVDCFGDCSRLSCEVWSNYIFQLIHSSSARMQSGRTTPCFRMCHRSLSDIQIWKPTSP